MKNRLSFKFTRVLIGLIRAAGLGGVRRLADFLGAAMWLLLRNRRGETIQSIAERLHVDEDKARKIARASFRHTARSFLDILIAGEIIERELPRNAEESMEYLEKLRVLQRPVIICTAHFGPWELGGAFIAKAPGKRVFSVVRNYGKHPFFNDLVKSLRLEYGMETTGHRNAAGEVLKALRENNIACFLVDHNSMAREAVFLPFLGRLAAVNMGPALLALRSKAIVQPVFARREPGGGYSFILEEPLDTLDLSGSMQEKIASVAEHYTRAVEKQVLARPEQWFWMHRRWKTQPPV